MSHCTTSFAVTAFLVALAGNASAQPAQPGGDFPEGPGKLANSLDNQVTPVRIALGTTRYCHGSLGSQRAVHPALPCDAVGRLQHGRARDGARPPAAASNLPAARAGGHPHQKL